MPSLVVASCSSDEPELAPPFNTRGGLTADSTAADSARMQGDITIDSTWAGETVINFDFGPDADSPDFHTDSIRTGGNAGDAV